MNPICYICKLPNDETIAQDGFFTKELRPYGEKGQWVCFDCAFSTPEREKQTKQMLGQQLNACGATVVIGLNVGPTTLESIIPLFREAKT